MDKADFIQYIGQCDKLTGASLSDLERLVEEYPYFQTARLLLAKNRYQVNREDFKRNLGKTAVFCADRSRLFYLIYNERYTRFLSKDPSSEGIDRTQALLDSYLDTFSDGQEGVEPSGQGIVSTDYLAYLESREDESGADSDERGHNEFKHQDLIDRFLHRAAGNEIAFALPAREPVLHSVSETEPDNDGFLTETLAKIYIKQKKYEQALTIIKQLSLNFPKKSIYFADQIRFLELLILNEKNKKE